MINENSTFGGFLTDIGEAKQANANALGIPWKLTHMLIGDANGTDPVPDPGQTQLINQRYRAAINQLSVDPANPAILIAEVVLPPNIGGWWIRELAMEDEDEDFVAVANCPPSYKPLLAQGSGRNQVVRMHLILSNTANVQLKIDPSVVLATRKYVDDQRKAHEESREHPGATESAQGMIQRATNAQALAGSDNTRAMTPVRVHQAFRQFGLGGESAESAADALSGSSPSGIYGKAPGTEADGFPYEASWVFLQMTRGSRPVQVAADYIQDRMFFRSWRASGWSSWKELFHTGNLTPDDYARRDQDLSDLSDASAARTNLGLGSAATRAVGQSSGNVMEVGAFGLGTANVREISNLSALGSSAVSEFLNITNQQLLPGGGNSYGGWVVPRGSRPLVFFSPNGQRLGMSRWNGSEWQTAVEFFHTGDVTGGNQSLTGNGYQRMPGGLILQWGLESVGDARKTINLPIAFPSAFFAVIAVADTTNAMAPNNAAMLGVNRLGLSSFEVNSTSWDGTLQSRAIHWFALGT